MTSSLIAVILEQTLTKADRKLIDAGRGDMVRHMRLELQQTMRDDMVASIEDLTGRRVIGFLSDHQLEPDIAVETFVLERQPTPPDGELSLDGETSLDGHLSPDGHLSTDGHTPPVE